VVEGPSNQLFTGSAFSADQNRSIEIGNPHDLLFDLLETRALTKHFVIRVLSANLLFQQPDFLLQMAMLQGPIQRDTQ